MDRKQYLEAMTSSFTPPRAKLKPKVVSSSANAKAVKAAKMARDLKALLDDISESSGHIGTTADELADHSLVALAEELEAHAR